MAYRGDVPLMGLMETSQRRRVPRGSRRQWRLLQQGDIPPAQLGQMADDPIMHFRQHTPK